MIQPVMGNDVETAVELTRAEYNEEVDGLTIGAEPENCGFNNIEVGSQGLTWPALAQTLTPVHWVNGDYAQAEFDFSTNINWEIESNACDWFNDKDVEWLANHEFGHALSLGEHSGSDSTMYGACTSYWETVDSDTKAALENRY